MSSKHQLTDLLPLIKLDEFISFDLETTGLNPDVDKITEISACRFVKGEFSEEFTGPAEQVGRLFKEPVLPVNGVLSIPDRPGLGLEIDEEYLNSLTNK